MRKTLILFLVFILPTFSFADRADIVENMENVAELSNVKVLNEKFKLEKFDTQNSFETFIADKLYDKIINSCNKQHSFYWFWGIEKNMKEMNALWAVWWDVLWAISSADSIKSISPAISNSFWETNIQKKWVDEPEILKLWKDYIAYYNAKEWKIFIIKSPNVQGKLNLNKVEITHEVKVPSLINKHQVKLFYVKDQLIVVWWRYSKSFNWNITDIVFYKISNGKAVFDRIYDVKWDYADARIVDWKIYLITNYNFSNMYGAICEKYIQKPLQKTIDELKTKYDTMYRSSDWLYEDQIDRINKNAKLLQEEVNKLLKDRIKSLNKKEILKEIEKWFMQKSIDIKIDKNSKFKLNNREYPLDIDIIRPSIDNVIFLPTNFDKINIYDLNFSLTNIIDLDKQTKASQYVMFGNMWDGEIHMTQKSLYLVNNYYISYDRRCPAWTLCMMPYYHRWNFSLIHKLSINWQNLDYIDSSVIPWRPINQYSMDEDSFWNFRIFTKSHYPQRKTSLFTFDDKMKMAWSILSIAPEEEFKSSRFIEDKVYLVTFKATDPLFAIDLKDNKNPKIVWELKIPWYSLYMHPYAKEWNIQYLVWIGQEAEELDWNRSLPKNIKIDLYKINYNKKDKNWNISVTQEFSKILWKEEKVGNWWSFTPSFTDPRTFVMFDNADSSKTLLLPVYLVEDTKAERCNINYIRKDWKRIENWQNCNEYITKYPYFVWIKWLNIDKNKWITEVLSKNYVDKFKEKNSLWNYQNENHRVSYYAADGVFAPFEVNTKFFNMFTDKQDKFIEFSWK